jgi:hypothetical protein
MNKEELKQRIKELMAEAKDDYDWGGGETRDGVLMKGNVDFNALTASILEAVDKMNTPAKPPEG